MNPNTKRVYRTASIFFYTTAISVPIFVLIKGGGGLHFIATAILAACAGHYAMAADFYKTAAEDMFEALDNIRPKEGGGES